MGEELAGVGWVSGSKGNGCSRQGSSSFTGKIGAWALDGDLVGGARGGNVLGAIPAGVVGGPVSDLAVDNIRLGMRLEDVVGPPPDGGEGIGQLTLLTQLAVKLHHSPCQEGYGVGHGEAELHVVACIVVASREIDLRQNTDGADCLG